NPQLGDWSGIKFMDAARVSHLEHAWVLHGGGIVVAGAAPELRSVGAVRNAGAGLAVTSGAEVSAQSLYLAFNETGVATRDAGSAATLTGSILLNNQGNDAYAADDTDIEATGNWWGSASAPTIA